jgi:hypothetical protein
VRDASIVVNGITEYQQALSAWERRTVVNPLEVSPGPRDTHYVVVQLEDEPTIVESSAYIAGKHFKNSTLIQMDLLVQLQPFYQNHRLDYILL